MPVTFTQVQTLALGLPEAHTQEHHGFPSFRVGARIFATFPDDAHVNVMLSPEQVPWALALDPAFEALHWGQKLAGVRIDLNAAELEPVGVVLEQAGRRVATKRGLKERPG